MNPHIPLDPFQSLDPDYCPTKLKLTGFDIALTGNHQGRTTSEHLPQVGWNCLADCFYPPKWFGGIKGGMRSLNWLQTDYKLITAAISPKLVEFKSQ